MSIAIVRNHPKSISLSKNTMHVLHNSTTAPSTHGAINETYLASYHEGPSYIHVAEGSATVGRFARFCTVLHSGGDDVSNDVIMAQLRVRGVQTETTCQTEIGMCLETIYVCMYCACI